jgi:hypothetical protein
MSENKIYSSFVLVFNLLISGFSISQGCLNVTMNPVTTFSPVQGWSSIDSCSKAGEFANINVVNGGLYTFSTRASDGSNVNYDSQLTLRNELGEVLAYNDDAAANDLQSSLTWLANFDGIVQIHLNEYECASNDSCSKIMVNYNAPLGLNEVANTAIPVCVSSNQLNGEITVHILDEMVNQNLKILMYSLNGAFVLENKIVQTTTKILMRGEVTNGVYLLFISNEYNTKVYQQLVTIY